MIAEATLADAILFTACETGNTDALAGAGITDINRQYQRPVNRGSIAPIARDSLK